MFNLKITVFFIFLPTFLLAQQDLETCWERAYLPHKDSPEKIHDVFLMPNGYLAMVGEVQNKQKEKGKDGLFMIVDSKTGEKVARRVFSDFRKEVLPVAWASPSPPRIMGGRGTTIVVYWKTKPWPSRASLVSGLKLDVQFPRHQSDSPRQC